MKRFHVHVAVDRLGDSIRFYSRLFDSEPSVLKEDYAKWMLDDPRVNFAISQRGHAAGVNHLGIQVDSAEALDELHGLLEETDTGVLEESDAACCYAKSDKYWVTDPSGIAWESFHTLGDIEVFGESVAAQVNDGACCIPLAKGKNDTADADCCVPVENADSRGCCR